PADFRLVAAAPARDDRDVPNREWRRELWLDRHDYRLSRAWAAALYGALYRPDRVFLLLLHRDRVQPDRDRRQSAQIRRLHPGHPAGQEHRRSSRLCPHPPHGGWRGVSGGGLHPSRDPDLAIFG